MRCAKLYSLVLPLIIITLALLPKSSNAYFENYLVLHFDETIGYADVSPYGNGTVSLSGTLHASTDYMMEITISAKVEGSNTEDWVAYVSPNYIRARAGTHNISVYVSVKAPIGTNFDTSGNVIISARGTPWGTGAVPVEASEQLLVAVKPYRSFLIAASQQYVEVAPYGKLPLYVSIMNLGNAAINDLKINVENIEELKALGWNVIALETNLESAPQKTVNTNIIVETSREWNVWKDTIQKVVVNVTSATAGFSESLAFYLRLRGSYIPDFDVTAFIFALIIIIFVMIMQTKKR